MSLTKSQLQQLLTELYQSDPNLKKQERELISIINQISASAPVININPAFIKKLKNELMSQVTVAKVPVVNYNIMKKLIYSFYGAGAMVLVLALGFAVMNGKPAPVVTKAPTPAQQVAVIPKLNQLGEMAFGSLSTVSAGPAMMAERGAVGMGGGGGGSATAMTSAVAPVADAKRIMPPFEMKNYRYVYKGKALELKSDKLAVLKRVRGLSTVEVPDLISGLGMDFINANSFSGQSLQNLTLIQRSDFGYITNINLDEGLVSIYQNWETWPAGKCGNDNACFEAQRVSMSDLSAEADLIKTANQFISDHNIKVSDYGDPEINSDWRRYYDLTTDKTNYYLPEAVEVIYPQLIDGKFVYDEWSGAKVGLSISVHAKYKKVVSVNNLASQNFDSSLYEMETDAKQILAYAEQASNGGIYYMQEDQANKVETVEVELGQPEESFIKIYIYRDGRNNELLVPALRFPIINAPQDVNFYRKSVVVPLAKEILAERLNSVIPSGGPSLMMKN